MPPRDGPPKLKRGGLGGGGGVRRVPRAAPHARLDALADALPHLGRVVRVGNFVDQPREEELGVLKLAHVLAHHAALVPQVVVRRRVRALELRELLPGGFDLAQVQQAHRGFGDEVRRERRVAPLRVERRPDGRRRRVVSESFRAFRRLASLQRALARV